MNAKKKEMRGRPKAGEKERKVRFTTWMSESEAAPVNKAIEDESLPKSVWIRRALIALADGRDRMSDR